MKKILSLICVVILLLSSAVASAEFDFHSMSNTELEALIEQAQAELDNRDGVQEENSPVFYDANGIKMYLSGEYKVQWAPMAKADILYLEYIIENNSTHELDIRSMDAYVNGWDIDGISFYAEPKPGKKGKDYMAIKLTPAGISTFEEIKEVEFILEIFYDGRWMRPADIEALIKMRFEDGKIIFERD